MDGEKTTCETCRYWSELIAEATAGGSVLAMCLCSGSVCSGRMMTARSACEGWEDAPLGSVDSDLGRALY